MQWNIPSFLQGETRFPDYFAWCLWPKRIYEIYDQFADKHIVYETIDYCKRVTEDCTSPSKICWYYSFGGFDYIIIFFNIGFLVKFAANLLNSLKITLLQKKLKIFYKKVWLHDFDCDELFIIYRSKVASKTKIWFK